MTQIRRLAPLIISIAFVVLAAGLLVTADGDAEQARVGAMALLFFGGCGIVLIAEPIAARARARRTHAETGVFRFDAPRFAVIALGTAAAAGGIALMTDFGPSPWIARSAAFLVAIAALFLGVFALDRRPKLVIDAEGVFDARLLRAKAPWSAIGGIAIAAPWGVPVIELHPAEGAPFPRSRRGPFGGPRRLQITAIQLDGGIEDILAAIHRFRPEIIVLGLEGQD